ncbi:MAG: dipicolinate synthase subunit DpsA [Clostridiales bacterium]
MDSNKSNKIILIIGGDLRQLHTANYFTLNYNVYIFGFDKEKINFSTLNVIDNLKKYDDFFDYIILPLPISRDNIHINMPCSRNQFNLDRIIITLKNKGIIFGGIINTKFNQTLKQKNISYFDYFEREELLISNAIPTSEGAIQIAMEKLQTTIYKQDILIIGYGRISKVLVKSLLGLGAKVNVAARNYSDMNWIEISGCKAIPILNLDNHLYKYGVIFNTVPHIILNEYKLKLLKKDCLIVDLASKPGGVDFKKANELGIKNIWALGLPGKTAPKTAGEIIAKTISNILEEKKQLL